MASGFLRACSLSALFAVLEYDALRKEVGAIFADKTDEVRDVVGKLHKTQRAAEETLDKCAFLL